MSESGPRQRRHSGSSGADARRQAQAVGDRVVRMYTFAATQPAWVTRVALGAMALAMTLLILMLAIPAVAIFLLVFFGAVLVNRLREGWRRLFGRPDAAGRRNVRVIAHRHE